jgi:hypothetical protein
MHHRNESFENTRIELRGQSYQDCTFRNCELVFNGDRPPTLTNNRFTDTVFVFTDAATRTLYLLSNVYHAGEGGREVVERMFADIRTHELHGHEIRTQAPHTVDHSFD